MNGCAPGLALIKRLKVTRKWAIQLSRSDRKPGKYFWTLSLKQTLFI